MGGPTYFDHLEPSSLDEVAKLRGRPKHRSSPNWITEPTAETAV